MQHEWWGQIIGGVELNPYLLLNTKFELFALSSSVDAKPLGTGALR